MLLRHSRLTGAAAAGKAFCPFGPPEASPSSQLVLCVLLIAVIVFEAVGNPCVGGSPSSVAGREAGNFSGMFFN